jgi:glutathione S-transferase
MIKLQNQRTIAMTIRLYGSWLSPFARKVALALELKALPYDYVDGLLAENRAELHTLNPRGEVPVLVDDGVVVINSSDIVQYLDWRYPEPALYPAAAVDRVAMRALERLADSRLDPIIVDTSFWRWAEREDSPPTGLMEAAQRDLDTVLGRLEQALAPRPTPWPFGAPGLAECAWFANLIAVRPMGFALDAARFPGVLAWLRAMRTHPVFAADAKRTAAFLKDLKTTSVERRKLFWSGERIEWLLARGFHDWFFGEIAAGRAMFPN